MNVATLVIAILGLVLGVVSLVWQAATFVLSGGRVTVELRAGAMNGAGMLVSVPVSSASVDTLARMTEEGYHRPMMAVRVRNTGRMAVTVTGWSLVTDHGITFSPMGASIGKPLHHRMEAGETETWATDAVEITRGARAAAETFNVPAVALRGRVELGDGRVVDSPQELVVNRVPEGHP